jgi:hypothetical protein
MGMPREIRRVWSLESGGGEAAEGRREEVSGVVQRR